MEEREGIKGGKWKAEEVKGKERGEEGRTKRKEEERESFEEKEGGGGQRGRGEERRQMLTFLWI